MNRVNSLPEGPAAIVLGIMQDAGLPHAGCGCSRCAPAFAHPDRAEYAAGLAIVDPRPQQPAVWLIDATPDIKYQLHLLSPFLGPNPNQGDRLRQPDGILLTHAHMGHTAGLVHLGPEGMNVRQLPVYASAGLVHVLRETSLWRPLVERLNLNVLENGRPLRLGPDLIITPVTVPHRDELGAGTFGFLIQGPGNNLLYIPDIDDWKAWPAARATLSTAGMALVDATFYSRDELGGRPPVAHPLVPDTLAFCAGLPVQLLLTHINHTNPILDPGSEARLEVETAGAKIATTGQVIPL